MKKALLLFTLPLFLLGITLLFSCIQGPWDYRAEDGKIFRGITVNAYIVHGFPIKSVCFERLYTLTEEYTDAFPFYSSAQVEVRGDGGNGDTTISLTPRPGAPSCFEGPDDFRGVAGETYELRAVFSWDSAGIPATTTVTAMTTIPERFSVERIARANSAVFSGAFTTVPDSPAGLSTLLEGLPETVSSAIIELYLPEIAPIANDSAALLEYLIDNRQRISNSIDSLLDGETLLLPYNEFDTVNYLGGALNLTSHFFKSNYSDDVRGVLVSHAFTEDAENPATRFDNIIETFRELTPADFYFAGTIRRLQFYSRLEGEQDDFRLFDAIPVNNATLKGGKNTLYFYGVDLNYAQFVPTYIEAHASAKIQPVHSVQGAEGFFAGMHVDSFTVYIRILPQITSYTTFEARADFCSDNDWDNADCRSFEMEYCAEVLFNDLQYAHDYPERIRMPEQRNDCLAEAVAFYLSRGKPLSYLQDSVLVNGNQMKWQQRTSNGSTERTTTFTQNQLSDAQELGLLRYCLRDDFGDEVCDVNQAALRDASVDDPQLNEVYNYCIDNQWESTFCGWAMVRYVQQNSNAAKALKDQAQRWCSENDDAVCRN